jgi:hypothetical protein
MRLGLLIFVAMLMVTGPVAAQDGALVAVAATPSGDGVLDVPVGGVAAFAFAVMNYGTTGVEVLVTASPSSFVPSNVSVVLVCFTDPTSGQCLVPGGTSPFPPDRTVGLSPGAGATGTVYVQATSGDLVPFDPTTVRIGVSFSGAVVYSPFQRLPFPGAEYASTSVALRVR